MELLGLHAIAQHWCAGALCPCNACCNERKGGENTTRRPLVVQRFASLPKTAPSDDVPRVLLRGLLVRGIASAGRPRGSLTTRHAGPAASVPRSTHRAPVPTPWQVRLTGS